MKAQTTELPTGTVTFLFTDIEGSTNLARTLGDRWPVVLDEHHRILRKAVRDHGGIDMQTEGDSLFAVFRSAVNAVAACADAQRGLSAYEWPSDGRVQVRMGLHTGEGRLSGNEYRGLDVHRAARISAAGHGGQVLASETTRALAADTLPNGVVFRDLGDHRLKDFDEAQAIYQLVVQGLAADFPPLKTLDVPTNLPTQVTSFIGRDRELAQIQQMLDSARLLTLTGPGGSGKTRLAQRAASELLNRYPDGVFLVDLSSTRDAELVPSVIAGALGIREEGPRPLLETLQSELRDRSTLLVLDNFEQVMDAARVLSALLASAPRVRLLVTSRGPLRIRGEQEFAVPPLALPDGAGDSRTAHDLSRFEAVTLFVARARAVDPEFQLTDRNATIVSEIAKRLDGLPLALELAASRVRLLTPEAILDRLDRALPLLAGGPRDVPDRQRTLRGAIEWSYDLLPADVASLFRRLSVFAGGFGIEAVDAVCRPADQGVDGLEGLEVLLEHALIRRATDTSMELRFDTLQTIREFGRERLAQEEAEAEVRRRHAEHFLALAERAAPELRGPRSEQYLELLEREHDNLRAALTWALERDEGDVALRLVGALWRFWHLRGHLTGGRRWASQALGLPSAEGRSAARAKALIGEGGLAYWQTDPSAVRKATEEALEIAKDLGGTDILAAATYSSAFWHPFEGEFAVAVAIFRRALAMYRELGDRLGIADTLFAISILGRLQGDLESGLTSGEEALKIHRQLGDMFGMTGSLFSLGRAYPETGDLEAARSLFLESLGLAKRMQDRTGIAIFFDNFAEQANLLGDHVRSMRIAGASQAVKDAIGGEAPPAMVHLPDPREVARQHLSKEEMQAAWQEGYAGLTLGGGFGWLMRKYGLTIDNLLAAEVVTADGNVVEASAAENTDLFWGLRGGGGNFGIVTSFTYRLNPVGPTVVSGLVLWALEDGAEVGRFYREWALAAPDELTTALIVRRAPAVDLIPAELHGRPVIGVACCWVGEHDRGEAALAAMRRFGTPIVDLVSRRTFVEHQGLLDPSFPHGIWIYSKASDVAALSDGVLEVMLDHGARIRSLRSAMIAWQLGGAVARVGALDTAFSSNRSGYLVDVVGATDSADGFDMERLWARDCWDALASYRTGAYVNWLMEEGDEHVREVYGEERYRRLQAVKRRYDPKNVFHLNQNVVPG